MSNPKFILEEIDPAKRAAIIRGAVGNPTVQKLLAYADCHDAFADVRAIDPESGNFLMTAPVLVRPEGSDCEFLVQVQGTFFLFSLDRREELVAFHKGSVPPAPMKNIVQETVVEAFDVHGLFGEGPLGESGIPVWSVRPKFSEQQV